jgi:integrase
MALACASSSPGATSSNSPFLGTPGGHRVLRPFLEERDRGRATVARRLCTAAGFHRYAEEEGLLAPSPAVHARRPRLDYDSHAVGLDRNKVGALLVAAGLGPTIEHALISVLALNGLRVLEATGATSRPSASSAVIAP